MGKWIIVVMSTGLELEKRDLHSGSVIYYELSTGLAPYSLSLIDPFLQIDAVGNCLVAC